MGFGKRPKLHKSGPEGFQGGFVTIGPLTEYKLTSLPPPPSPLNFSVALTIYSEFANLLLYYLFCLLAFSNFFYTFFTVVFVCLHILSYFATFVQQYLFTNFVQFFYVFLNCLFTYFCTVCLPILYCLFSIVALFFYLFCTVCLPLLCTVCLPIFVLSVYLFLFNYFCTV